MSAESNKALIRRLVEFLNKHNSAPVEGFDEFFAPGYSYHNLPFPEVKDLASFKQLNAAIASAFSDNNLMIEDMLAEGDKIVWRYSATGTHKGDFMGVAATGKRVTVAGIVISRVMNDRVQEEWECLDELGLMQQLGVVPELGSGN